MRKTCCFFVMVLFFALCVRVAEARDVADGFKAARVIQTRYFTVHIEEGVDIEKLETALLVPFSLRAIIERPVPYADSMALEDQLDLFYLTVAELLDMWVPEFNCVIKICKDSHSLVELARRVFAVNIPRTPGFYADQLNTVYLDATRVDANLVGHELAHAIQNNYFLVRPPEKVQEILSGYVEYQFRKYTHTLPSGRRDGS